MASATSTATETKNVINLKGSAKLIREFMEYSINMILFQREVYHDEEFEKVDRYGRPVFLTTNEKLKQYLNGVLSGLKESIENDECKKMVLVIISVDTEEPIEKWEFSIEPESGDEENADPSGSTSLSKLKIEPDPYAKPDKNRTASRDLKLIQQEMMKIMKQIIGAVTYLPCRGDTDLTFNILLYTKKRGEHVMANWQESHAHDLAAGNGEEEVQVLQFDNLSTGVNKVRSKVEYKIQNCI